MEADFREYEGKNTDVANELIKTLFTACEVNYNRRVSAEELTTTGVGRPKDGFEPY